MKVNEGYDFLIYAIRNYLDATFINFHDYNIAL